MDSDPWKLPWRATCRCGAVVVEVTEPPMITFACHCRGCQKMSASAYSTTIVLPATALSVVEGEVVQGGLCKDDIHHCRRTCCKTWMFTRPQGFPFVNLRPSMLEDPSWVVPFAESYVAEKLPWAETPAVHSYDTVPEMSEYEALAADFAERGCKP